MVLGAAQPVFSPSVHRWGRWEASFASAQESANPVQDQGFTFEFSSPTGKQRTSRAFWDGGSIWRVRFSPDEAGEWSFSARSTHGEEIDLSGSYQCTPYDGENPLYRHGAIRVAQHGTYLGHADGTPFFFLADTCWNGPHLSTPDEWRHYLADRTAKRFNAVIFTGPHFRGLAANADGRTAYSGQDRIEIDPLFFQRLDRGIDAMNDLGFLAVPLLLHGGKDTDRNAGYHLPQDQAILLARYIVARYDAHHVLWNLIAEAEFHGWGARYWQQVGRAVFAEGSNHPVTLHPYGMDWALYSFVNETWMDVVGYQSAHGDSEASLRWIPQGSPSWSWVLSPPRPFINLEPPYEGHLAFPSGTPFDAATVRRHAVWSLFAAPVAGVGYGGHGVWGWDDGTGAPFAHEATGKSPAWHEALHLPGATSMKIISEIMAELPWTELKPAPELLSAQPGKEDARCTVSAVRSQGERVALVYSPRGSRMPLRLESLPSTVTLISPATGECTMIDPPATPGDWPVPLPDSGDWFALLAW